MDPIPEALKAFIFASFETVDQLRILLLLQANPARTWSALLVSSKLHLQPDVAQTNLQILCQKGFLALSNGASPQYGYQPANAELEQMARAMSELDRTRPVTLIRLIYARPKEMSQTAGNSTELRRDD
jgi:hypothetical protein